MSSGFAYATVAYATRDVERTSKHANQTLRLMAALLSDCLCTVFGHLPMKGKSAPASRPVARGPVLGTTRPEPPLTNDADRSFDQPFGSADSEVVAEVVLIRVDLGVHLDLYKGGSLPLHRSSPPFPLFLAGQCFRGLGESRSYEKASRVSRAGVPQACHQCHQEPRSPEEFGGPPSRLSSAGVGRLSAAEQAVQIVLNGPDPAPRQERRLQRRVRQPVRHRPDDVGGEARHLARPFRSVRCPAATLAPGRQGPGQSVGALPGQRWIADAPRDTKGLGEVALRLRPIARGHGDLAPERMALGDVLGGAGGPPRRGRALNPGQRLAGPAERDQSLCEVRRHVHLPAPAVRPEPGVGPALRVLEQRKRLGGLAQVKVVVAEVDQRADLDIAVLDLLPDIGGLAVVFHGSRKVPELLMEPADRVLEPPDEELVVAILCLREAVADHGEALGMVALSDVDLATKGYAEELVKPIPHFPGLVLGLADERQE